MQQKQIQQILHYWSQLIWKKLLFLEYVRLNIDIKKYNVNEGILEFFFLSLLCFKMNKLFL